MYMHIYIYIYIHTHIMLKLYNVFIMFDSIIQLQTLLSHAWSRQQGERDLSQPILGQQKHSC